MKSRSNVLSGTMGYSLRKMSIFLPLVLVLCGGCATGTKVTDNTFRYSYPKMEVKINPEFTYLGDVKYANRPELTSGVNIRQDTHAYVFISVKDSKVKKILSIAIENISVDDHSFSSSVFEGGTVEYTTRFERTRDMLDYGEQKLGRKSFKYYEKLIYLPLSNPKMTFLSDKGYILPTCVFLREFIRVFGRSSLMRFTYCEDLTDSGYGCAAWRNIHDLTADQKSYLADLRTNCMNTFDLGSTSKRYKEFKTYKEIKRYIEIKESDAVYEYGLEKYEVWPGDKLEIIGSKTCRGGRGLCWKVRNVKTGEIGYVRADRMKKTHHVYTEEK